MQIFLKVRHQQLNDKKNWQHISQVNPYCNLNLLYTDETPLTRTRLT